MDPRRVLTFRAVAHQRSFSRAARELALSQPSVSNQVAALEREIGVAAAARAGPAASDSPARARSCSSTPTPSPSASSSPAHSSPPPHSGQRARLRIGAFPTALAGARPGRDRPRARPDTPTPRSPSTRAPTTCPRACDPASCTSRSRFQDTAEPRHEPPGVERRDLLRERFMVALAPDHPLADKPGGAPRRPTRRRLDRRPDRRADRPRLPRRRLRAQPRLAHPRPTRHPRA